MSDWGFTPPTVATGVRNQQEWDTLASESSDAGWSSGKLDHLMVSKDLHPGFQKALGQSPAGIEVVGVFSGYWAEKAAVELFDARATIRPSLGIMPAELFRSRYGTKRTRKPERGAPEGQ